MHWPICLGISVTPLRERSRTKRFWKLAMKWGIFCSPVRCTCHSWTWLSWTRHPGNDWWRKEGQQNKIWLSQNHTDIGDLLPVHRAACYLPLLLFNSEDEASIFSLQLLFESSQSRPVFPNTNTQSEIGTWTLLNITEQTDQDYKN